MARKAQFNDQDATIAKHMAKCVFDPLLHVVTSYPWNSDPSIQVVPWSLEDGSPHPDTPVTETYRKRFPHLRYGPDQWQCERLDIIGRNAARCAAAKDADGNADALRLAVVSGHGIGKSTLSAWLCKWILDTRPYSVGTMTANTSAQLRTKTWAEVGKWHHLSLTRDWFRYVASTTTMSLTYAKDPDLAGRWKCFAQTCDPNNSEAFAGQHSDSTSFYIFDEACHDNQTEVMTRNGWKLFRDLTPKDQLFTPNGWETPSHVHSSWRKAPMWTVRKRGLSLSVTPNHEFYGQEYYSKRWVKKQADEIPFNFTVPRTVSWSASDNTEISDDFLKLLGWYFSEGHIIKNYYKPKNRNPKNKYAGFGITNNKDEGISELLDSLGYKWGKNRNQWIVYEPEVANTLAEYGDGCLKKTVPEWMFSLSQRQINIFLGVFIIGDGYEKSPNRKILYTSSEALANDFHALCVLAGYNSSMTRRKIKGRRTWIKDHWATSTCDGYVVSAASSGKPNTRLNPGSFEKTEYEGFVYCATVPSGMLLTRREGTVIWSGNSRIDDRFFEVREGGMAAGEPMAFDFGNGTRNTGRFFENCVGKYRDQYIVTSIDSREAYRVNKKKVEEDEKAYGEESDYFRTRWRGLFPSVGDMQFVPSGEVEEAAKRVIALNHKEDPLVLGVDVARMGGDESVIWPRIGYDCRSFEPRRYRGFDGEELANEVAQYISEFRQLGMKTRAVFVDAGGGYGGSVIDNLRRMGYPVIGVNPGERAIDRRRFALRIDEMWGMIRDHLGRLALPPLDTDLGRQLYEQLTQREYTHTMKEQVRLEPKASLRDRIGSPDLADALALTFARPILPGADNEGGATFVRTDGKVQ